jgi:hypothetical protein
MIDRQIDKPIPMPSSLVVKNVLKILSISFGLQYDWLPAPSAAFDPAGVVSLVGRQRFGLYSLANLGLGKHKTGSRQCKRNTALMERCTAFSDARLDSS